MAVTIGQWRWYSDATPDGSMVALAAENTAPTLTAAQNERGTIRLRVQLVGDATGGTVSVVCQHGVDGTNWKNWATTPTAGTNEWMRWGVGAATASATIGSQLLTGTTASGKYHEASAVSETVVGNAVLEVDIAVRVIWIGPGITVLTRILNTSTALAYGAGVPAIAFVGPPIGVRKYALDLAGTSTSGGQIREMDYSSWPRVFYTASGYHWFFGSRPALDGSTLMTYWRWDGSGGVTGTWARNTVALTGTVTTTTDGDVRHAPAHRRIGSADVFTIVSRPSSGNLRYIRGTESAGTVTWGSNADLGTTAGDKVHAAIDDGGYHWLAASQSTTQVWAVMTQTADTGGAYTPDFGTITTRRFTLTDVVDTLNPVTVLPIGSQVALVFWYDGTNTRLRCAKVTTSGFGTPVTVPSTTPSHKYDWGVTRSNGWVYVTYRNGIDDTNAAWIAMAYNISSDTWATIPGTVPKATQNSNNDGLVLTADGDTIYTFGTAIGSEGNQDRPGQYVKYDGPGTTGAWDTTITSGTAGALAGAVNGTGLMFPGNRGNGDDITGIRTAGGGKIILVYLFGDNDVNGHPFTYEYHTLTVTAAGTVNADDAEGTGAAHDAVAQVAGSGSANATAAAGSGAAHAATVDATGSATVAAEFERYNGSVLVLGEVERYDGAALVLQRIDKLA
jgi:hypothetical protein